MDWYDDDNAAGPPAPGTGSGSEAAISAAADAALEGWQAANKAAGKRCVAAHELMAQCVRHPDCRPDPDRPGFTVVDAEVMATSHLARMFPISTYKAGSLLSFAADLHFRYPAILEAMLAGRMDETTARALAEQMSHVDESVLDQVQREVVEDYLDAIAAGERPGNKAVRSRADELISRRDRDAVRARKADAGRERGASISRARDGMARLYALLHADEAAILAEALDEKVAADRAAEEDAAARIKADADDVEPGASGAAPDSDDEAYSLAQRRADALMSLVCGDASPSGPATAAGATSGPAASGPSAAGAGEASSNSTGPGETSTEADQPGPTVPDGSGQATRSGVILRPKITVIAPGGGVDGGSQRARVEFARTGEAALQSLLEMLESCDGASLQHIDPAPDAADDAEAALRYRPSTALANQIRLRDGTCRHPGCTVPIEDCDLDHVVPFDRDNPSKGGLTVEQNLAGLCREHHRFKTFNDWDYRLEPDGTLIITTPEGKMMLTRPDGPLAAYRREQSLAEARAWKRQQGRNPDPGRAAANGSTRSSDQFEKSSWARRADRTRARRREQRTTNATMRAEELAAELVAAEERRIPVEHGVRDLLRTHRRYKDGLRPIVVTATPGANDVPARRHSRWWVHNRPRYQDAPPAAPGSGLYDALRAALEIIRADETDPPPF